jgi:hypothetical protein
MAKKPQMSDVKVIHIFNPGGEKPATTWLHDLIDGRPDRDRPPIEPEPIEEPEEP